MATAEYVSEGSGVEEGMMMMELLVFGGRSIKSLSCFLSSTFNDAAAAVGSSSAAASNPPVVAGCLTDF
jgi:hypothetical protein